MEIKRVERGVYDVCNAACCFSGRMYLCDTKLEAGIHKRLQLLFDPRMVKYPTAVTSFYVTIRARGVSNSNSVPSR